MSVENWERNINFCKEETKSRKYFANFHPSSPHKNSNSFEIFRTSILQTPSTPFPNTSFRRY